MKQTTPIPSPLKSGIYAEFVLANFCQSLGIGLHASHTAPGISTSESHDVVIPMPCRMLACTWFLFCTARLLALALDERQALDPRWLSLVAADWFAPKYYDGATNEAATECLKVFFEMAREAAKEDFSHLKEPIESITGALSSIKTNVEDIWEGIKKLQPQQDLDACKQVFAEPGKSVFFHCGFHKHSMKGEIVKISKNRFKVFIFNSGAGLQYHFSKMENLQRLVCSVLVFEAEDCLVNKEWVQVMAEIRDSWGSTEKTFYQALLGDFQLAEPQPNLFVIAQRTGTCTMSSFHMYFKYKFGEDRYNEIYPFMILTILDRYLSMERCDFTTELFGNFMKKNSAEDLNVTDDGATPTLLKYFQTSVEPTVTGGNQNSPRTIDGSPQKPIHFNIQRYNADLIEWIIRHVCKISILSGPVEGLVTSESSFAKAAALVFGKFQERKKKVSLNYRIGKINPKEMGKLTIRPGERPNLLEGKVIQESILTAKFHCNLPRLDGNLSDIASSIAKFLNEEQRLSQCFENNPPLILGFFMSFVDRLEKMFREQFPNPDDDTLCKIMDILTNVFQGFNSLVELNADDSFYMEKAFVSYSIINIYLAYFEKHTVSKFPTKSAVVRKLVHGLKSSFAVFPWFRIYFDKDFLDKSLLKHSLYTRTGTERLFEDPRDKKPLKLWREYFWSCVQEDKPKRLSEIGSSLRAINLRCDLKTDYNFEDSFSWDYFKSDSSQGDLYDLLFNDELEKKFDKEYSLEKIEEMRRKSGCSGEPIWLWKKSLYIVAILSGDYKPVDKSFRDQYYCNYSKMVQKICGKQGNLMQFSNSGLLERDKCDIPVSSFYWYRNIIMPYFYEAAQENEAVMSFSRKKGTNNVEYLLSQRRSYSSALVYLMRLREHAEFLLTKDGMYYLYTLIIRPLREYDFSIYRMVFRYFVLQKISTMKAIRVLLDVKSKKMETNCKLLITYQVALNHLHRMNPSKAEPIEVETSLKTLERMPDSKVISNFLQIHFDISFEKKPNELNYLIIVNANTLTNYVTENEIVHVLSRYFDSKYKEYVGNTVFVFENSKNSKYKSILEPFDSITGEKQLHLISGICVAGTDRLIEKYDGPSYGCDFLDNLRQADKKQVAKIHYFKVDGKFYKGVSFGSLKLLFFQLDRDNCRYFETIILEKGSNGDSTDKAVGVLLNSRIPHCFQFIGNTEKLFWAYMFESKQYWMFNGDGGRYGSLNEDAISIDDHSKCFLSVAENCSLLLRDFKPPSTGETLFDALNNRAALFNFSEDAPIFTLENASDKTRFYFFGNYKSEPNDFYAIGHPSTDTCSLFVSGTKYDIVNPKTINTAPAKWNLPILFIKAGSQKIAIIKYDLYQKSRFAFLQLDCDKYFNFETKTTLQDLIMIYLYLKLQIYDCALEYAIEMNGSTAAFGDDEIGVIRLIFELDNRDIEYLVFRAYLAGLLADNEMNFGKKTKDLDSKKFISSLNDICELIPAKYFQISRTFLPNLWNKEQAILYGTFMERIFVLDENCLPWRDSDIWVRPELSSLVKVAFSYTLWPSTFDLTASFRPNVESLGSVSRYFQERMSNLKSAIDFKNAITEDYLRYFRFYKGAPNDNAKIAHDFFHILHVCLKNADSETELNLLYEALKEGKKDGYKAATTLLEKIYNSHPSKLPRLSGPKGKTADIKDVYNVLEKFKGPKNGLFFKTISILSRRELKYPTLKAHMNDVTMADASRDFMHFTRSIRDDGEALINVLLSSTKKRLRDFFKVKSKSSTVSMMESLWNWFYHEKYLARRESHEENCLCKVGEAVQYEQLGPVEKLFVVMEYHARFCLTAPQRSALRKIFDALNQNKPIIYQKMMGGGKTSVFGTCCALYSTHVLGRLPVFVFPARLVDQNASFMERRMWKYFKKKLFRLRMHRTTRNYGVPYLRFLLFNLVNHYVHEEAVVCSPEAIQCMQNARKELLVQHVMDDTGDQAEREHKSVPLRLVLHILHFVETKCLLIVDEIDTVMNLTKSLNFNMPDEEKHDAEKVKFFVDSFYLVMEKNRTDRMFDTRKQLQASEEDELEGKVRSTLATDKPQWVDDFLRTGFVPSLKFTKNVNYGLPHEGGTPHIVPYSSANTPTKSIFSNYWFMLSLTLKYYLEEPLAGRPFFLNDALLGEIFDAFSIEEDEREGDLYKQFLDCIYNSAGRERYFGVFFTSFVLPHIVTYERQYVNTPYEFITAGFQSFVAYSGTLYDKPVLQMIKSDAGGGKPNSVNIVIDDEEGQEVEHRILRALTENPLDPGDTSYPLVGGPAPSADTKSSKEKSEELLAGLVEFCVKCRSSALYDVGALLRDFKNDQVATKLLEHYPCVLYFDDATNTLVYRLKRDGKETSERAPDNEQFKTIRKAKGITQMDIFVYLDEAHTIGADVDLEDFTARTVVTVSSFVDKKSLLQGLLRARKLVTGVEFDSGNKIAKILPDAKRQSVSFFCMNLVDNTNGIESEFDGQMGKFSRYTFKNDSVKRIFTSCCINQVARDKKELALKERYFVNAHAIRCLFEPDVKGKVPNWDRLISISQHDLRRCWWMFFDETDRVEGGAAGFFRSNADLKEKYFQGINQALIDRLGVGATQVLERTTEVEQEQEQETELELQLEEEMVPASNSAEFSKSEFEPSDAPEFKGFGINVTKNFASTARGKINCNDSYSKEALFILKTDQNEMLAITMLEAELFLIKYLPYVFREYSKRFEFKTDPPNYFIYCPPTINLSDVTDLNLVDILPYFIYSGTAVGLKDILDGQRLRDLFALVFLQNGFSFDMWRKNAIKWRNSESLKFISSLLGKKSLVGEQCMVDCTITIKDGRLVNFRVIAPKEMGGKITEAFKATPEKRIIVSIEDDSARKKRLTKEAARRAEKEAKEKAEKEATEKAEKEATERAERETKEKAGEKQTASAGAGAGAGAGATKKTEENQTIKADEPEKSEGRLSADAEAIRKAEEDQPVDVGVIKMVEEEGPNNSALKATEKTPCSRRLVAILSLPSGFVVVSVIIIWLARRLRRKK